jgi:hypothetical protein
MDDRTTDDRTTDDRIIWMTELVDEFPQPTFVRALPAWDSFRPTPPRPRYLSQPNLPGKLLSYASPPLEEWKAGLSLSGYSIISRCERNLL